MWKHAVGTADVLLAKTDGQLEKQIEYIVLIHALENELLFKLRAITCAENSVLRVLFRHQLYSWVLKKAPDWGDSTLIKLHEMSNPLYDNYVSSFRNAATTNVNPSGNSYMAFQNTSGHIAVVTVYIKLLLAPIDPDNKELFSSLYARMNPGFFEEINGLFLEELHLRQHAFRSNMIGNHYNKPTSILP